MIDQFLESGHDLVEIEVDDEKPSYVAGMLKKRIQVRGLELKATAVSDVVYLEKNPSNKCESAREKMHSEIYVLC